MTIKKAENFESIYGVIDAKKLTKTLKNLPHVLYLYHS